VEDNANFRFRRPARRHGAELRDPGWLSTWCGAKRWKPTHAIFVPGVGMQIAASRFHTYNHNLIPELRILF
jgi:hypothetical protein